MGGNAEGYVSLFPVSPISALTTSLVLQTSKLRSQRSVRAFVLRTLAESFVSGAVKG